MSNIIFGHGLRGALTALTLVLAAVSGVRAVETTYYVSLDGDGSDGLTWGTAYTNIQHGIDAADPGDTVIVSNGTYVLSAMLSITKAIMLRSFEGKDVTFIDGNKTVKLLNVTAAAAGAVVEGFTFRNGFQSTTIALAAGTIRDCLIRTCGHGANTFGRVLDLNNAVGERLTIVENSMLRQGWIVQVRGTAVLRNSVVADNYLGSFMASSIVSLFTTSPAYGAGAAVYMTGGTIEHCTIAGNYSLAGMVPVGLRMTGGTVKNSIVYHNRDRIQPITDAANDLNVVHLGGTIEHSIMAPLVAGTGNLSADPQFVRLGREYFTQSQVQDGDTEAAGGDYRLGPGSPAINAGADLSVGSDLDGNARPVGALPDIGAYEARAADAGDLRVSFSVTNITAVGTNVTAEFTVHVAGANTNITKYDWDFGNTETSTIEDPGEIEYEVGYYTVRLEVKNDADDVAAWSNMVYRAPETVYMATGGTGTFPYDTPAKATDSLQRAINAAAVTASATSMVNMAAGAYKVESPDVVAGNGVVAAQLHKPLRVQGAGWDQTSLSREGTAGNRMYAGILHVYAAGARVSDIKFTGSAYHGVYMNAGHIHDCWFDNLSTSGTGDAPLTMTVGLADRCMFTGNSNLRHSSGVYMTGGTLRNSLIAGNASTHTQTPAQTQIQGSAVYLGSGARMENCTVVDNIRAAQNTALSVGGVYVVSGGVVVNSIVWYNRLYSTANDPDWFDPDDTDANIGGVLGGVTYTAAGTNVNPLQTTHLVHGVNGNLTPAGIDHPGFIAYVEGGSDNNFRLTQGSPCVNAGTLAGLDWITFEALDLDGNLRRVGMPDLGAYECQPSRGTIFFFR